MQGKSEIRQLRSIMFAASAAMLALSANPLLAQQSEVRSVEIAAQPLDAALVEIGQRYGISVYASTDVTEGQVSAPVSGRLTAEQALKRALSASRLTFVFRDGAYVIVKPSSAESDAPIVVLGQKTVKSLQDVQTSVTVFDERRIEQEALFDLGDALIRAPNVVGTSLRGIQQGGVGGAGTGQTSQLYVDGLPLSADGQGGAQALWDVGQVEVLLGPQSTIQGRNALAGAIVVSTNDPTYDWEAVFRAQVGSQETLRLSAVLNGPIIADQLAFRIAYDYNEFDGNIIETESGIPQDFVESHTVRGKLLFEPEFAPGLRLELIGEYIDTKLGRGRLLSAPVPFDDPAIVDFDPFGSETTGGLRFEEPETTKALVDLRYEVSDAVTLVALGTFEDNFRDRAIGILGPTGLIITDSPADTKTYSGELRAELDFGDLTGWIGAYYFENEQISGGSAEVDLALAIPFPLSPPDSVLSIIQRRVTSVQNYAIFADFTYELNEKLSLNLGARYDWEEFSDTGNAGSLAIDPPDCVIALPNGSQPCLNFVGGLAGDAPGAPADFEAFLPRASIVYTFTPDTSLGFSVARGYRAGGAVPQQNLADNTFAIVPFDPEFTTNYELSLRTQSTDGKWTVNANAFFTDWTDQQVGIPGPSGLPLDNFIENVGASELYGTEISVNFRPQEGLSAFATLGLLHTEFTDFPFAFVPGEFKNLAGREFPGARNVTASGGINYEDKSGFYISLSGNYIDETFSDVANLELNSVDDYFLANGRVGYRTGPIDIYVFANNLFDERVITFRNFVSVNTGTGGLNTTANALFGVNRPRIIGAGVQARF